MYIGVVEYNSVGMVECHLCTWAWLSESVYMDMIEHCMSTMEQVEFHLSTWAWVSVICLL